MNKDFELNQFEPSPEGIKEVTSIHSAEIPSGFMTSLGQGFLQIFYRSLACSKYSSFFVAEDKVNKKIVGFIVVTYDIRKLRTDMLRIMAFSFFSKEIFSVLLNLLRPSKIKGVIENLMYPQKNKDIRVSYSEIINFCVLKEYSGSGIGQALLEMSLAELRTQGVEKLQIATGENQLSAQRVYEKNGARIISTAVNHKKMNVIYAIDIVNNNN